MSEIINGVTEILQNWTNVTTVAGCLLAGYLIKQYVPTDNKHIPVIMAVIGVLITLALNGYVSFEVTILAGAASGLAATGVHQVYKQYQDDKKVKPEYFDVYKDKEDNGL